MADQEVSGQGYFEQKIVMGKGAYQSGGYDVALTMFSHAHDSSKDERGRILSFLYFRLAKLRKDMAQYDILGELSGFSIPDARRDISFIIARKNYFVNEEPILSDEDSKQLDGLIIELYCMIYPGIEVLLN